MPALLGELTDFYTSLFDRMILILKSFLIADEPIWQQLEENNSVYSHLSLLSLFEMG